MKPVSKDEFRRACSRFASGVTIAAVRDAAGEPHGMTVSSFTSVSLTPPLVLICLSHKASVMPHFQVAATFGVSMLRDGDRHLSTRFAAKDADRFDGILWHPAPCGSPLLNGALAAVECATVNKVTAGDHDVFIAEMIYTEVEEGLPLIYFGSDYRTIK
jgi:flavin reductase (DIM6/NTAB) family NADH-FMN oxidoreductase RutF